MWLRPSRRAFANAGRLLKTWRGSCPSPSPTGWERRRSNTSPALATTRSSLTKRESACSRRAHRRELIRYGNLVFHGGGGCNARDASFRAGQPRDASTRGGVSRIEVLGNEPRYRIVSAGALVATNTRRSPTRVSPTNAEDPLRRLIDHTSDGLGLRCANGRFHSLWFGCDSPIAVAAPLLSSGANVRSSSAHPRCR